MGRSSEFQKTNIITDLAESSNWYLLENPELCTTSLCNPELKRGSQLYGEKRAEEKKNRTKNRKQCDCLKVIFLKGQAGPIPIGRCELWVWLFTLTPKVTHFKVPFD